MTFVSWLIIYHMMYIMLYARKLKCVAFHCTVNISFDVLDSFLLWVDKISYFIVTLSRLLGYNLHCWVTTCNITICRNLLAITLIKFQSCVLGKLNKPSFVPHVFSIRPPADELH